MTHATVRSSSRHGFTLVELLVVMGIIALLLALLMPTFRGVRAVAQQTACASNLRQQGIAIANVATSRARQSMPRSHQTLYMDATNWGKRSGQDHRIYHRDDHNVTMKKDFAKNWTDNRIWVCPASPSSPAYAFENSNNGLARWFYGNYAFYWGDPGNLTSDRWYWMRFGQGRDLNYKGFVGNTNLADNESSPLVADYFALNTSGADAGFVLTNHFRASANAGLREESVNNSGLFMVWASIGVARADNWADVRQSVAGANTLYVNGSVKFKSPDELTLITYTDGKHYIMDVPADVR